MGVPLRLELVTFAHRMDALSVFQSASRQERLGDLVLRSSLVETN